MCSCSTKGRASLVRASELSNNETEAEGEASEEEVCRGNGRTEGARDIQKLTYKMFKIADFMITMTFNSSLPGT